MEKVVTRLTQLICQTTVTRHIFKQLTKLAIAPHRVTQELLIGSALILMHPRLLSALKVLALITFITQPKLHQELRVPLPVLFTYLLTHIQKIR